MKTPENICKEGNLYPSIQEELSIHINSQWWDAIKPTDSVLFLVLFRQQKNNPTVGVRKIHLELALIQY